VKAETNGSWWVGKAAMTPPADETRERWQEANHDYDPESQEAAGAVRARLAQKDRQPRQHSETPDGCQGRDEGQGHFASPASGRLRAPQQQAALTRREDQK
jgi:hypothetical protein